MTISFPFSEGAPVSIKGRSHFLLITRISLVPCLSDGVQYEGYTTLDAPATLVWNSIKGNRSSWHPKINYRASSPPYCMLT